MSTDDQSSSVPKGEGPFNRRFLFGFFGGLVVSIIVWALGRHHFVQFGFHAYYRPGYFFGPFNHSVLVVVILELSKFALGIYLLFVNRWKTPGLGLLASAAVGAMIFVGVCAFAE
jgi:hypothetical protein